MKYNLPNTHIHTHTVAGSDLAFHRAVLVITTCVLSKVKQINQTVLSVFILRPGPWSVITSSLSAYLGYTR